MLRPLSRIIRRLRGSTVLRAAAGAAALVMLTGGAVGSAQPAQPGGLTVRLQKGWNNVPYYGPTAEPQAALAPIAGRFSAVYYWDALQQRYLSYDPSNPTGGELTQLQAGRAYWIVASADVELTLPPPVAGAVPALAPGWNNFIYTGPPAPVLQALAFLAGHYTRVYRWDAALQRFRKFTFDESANDLATVEPYGCYWLDFA